MKKRGLHVLNRPTNVWIHLRTVAVLGFSLEGTSLGDRREILRGPSFQTIELTARATTYPIPKLFNRTRGNHTRDLMQTVHHHVRLETRLFVYTPPSLLLLLLLLLLKKSPQELRGGHTTRQGRRTVHDEQATNSHVQSRPNRTSTRSATGSCYVSGLTPSNNTQFIPENVPVSLS